MLQALIDSKDFLALTLAHPESLGEGFSYALSNQTQVEVWDTGVIVFEPHLPLGKDIILSCGVHGNETAPIELCNGLIKAILEEKIEVKHRTLFIIGNPLAINNGTRIIDENMNRLFSGEHSNAPGLVNPERIRAQKLEAYVSRFFTRAVQSKQRIHYDLHTAMRASKHEKFAIYPYRPGRAYSGEQMMFLAASGVDTILFHHEPTTTFSYFSSAEFGADAFTIELGKVYPMGQNDMTRFIAAKDMFTRLITDYPLDLEAYNPTKLHLYQVYRVINKHFDDFEFTFATDVENFRSFPKGFVLAHEGGNAIKVEQEFEAIVFPNAKVPIGNRTVICLIPPKNLDIQ
ncbi:succinylglutamate desuccinylase [Shewanella acanthi]|uniref:succinylglutamate desuccinylase n=1 Tax=Shewanella acanthi TaxID=2864212 RepID=UPI001C65CBF0|nr:succinylglutamate desuccinylase [Shewanella acanthi]QYJ80438.1 succinylglutamate desuccinylase [Shewanella acanthi]